MQGLAGGGGGHAGAGRNRLGLLQLVEEPKAPGGANVTLFLGFVRASKGHKRCQSAIIVVHTLKQACRHSNTDTGVPAQQRRHCAGSPMPGQN